MISFDLCNTQDYEVVYDGAFLDLVSGLSRKTLGIESFSDYHESLIGRGYIS